MTNAITTNPQCPPVPKDVALRYCWTKPSDKLEERYQPAADWGFAQGLAAAERLAAEERQKGADEELEACVQWLKEDGMHPYPGRLRAARRSPPTLREQALALFQSWGDKHGPGCRYVTEADLLLIRQALEEAGDER